MSRTGFPPRIVVYRQRNLTLVVLREFCASMKRERRFSDKSDTILLQEYDG